MMQTIKAALQPAPHRALASWALLLLRLVAGTAFIIHGWQKVQDPFSWMGPESPVRDRLDTRAPDAARGPGDRLYHDRCRIHALDGAARSLREPDRRTVV